MPASPKPRPKPESLGKFSSVLTVADASRATYLPNRMLSRPAAVTDPASAPPAATPATPAEPAADPRHSDPAYWKARFEVTSGMLAAERKAKKDVEDRLTRQITELQTQTRTLQAAVPAAPIDLAAEFYTPEEIEKWGAEQCESDDSRSIARREEDHLTNGLPLRFSRSVTSGNADDQTAAENSKREFMDKIHEQVPDFDDADPRWVAWLQEIDPNTDAPRQAVLHHPRHRAQRRRLRESDQGVAGQPASADTSDHAKWYGCSARGRGCSDAVSRGRERARRADRCGSQGLLQTRSSRQGERRGTDCLRGSDGEAAKASCCCIDSGHAGATPILSGESKNEWRSSRIRRAGLWSVRHDQFQRPRAVQRQAESKSSTQDHLRLRRNRLDGLRRAYIAGFGARGEDSHRSRTSPSVTT